MFLGTMMRHIEIVSKSDYLQSQKGFTSKQYTADYLPQTANRMNIFAKYDFKIPDNDFRLNIKVSSP